jgi:hypothetical protein
VSSLADRASPLDPRLAFAMTNYKVQVGATLSHRGATSAGGPHCRDPPAGADDAEAHHQHLV